MMSDAGPLPGLVGILLFAVLWGMPVALVTSELSSAFPDDGGYSIWVGEAFGGFWGFQESYFSWISGVVDNAIYPGLVYSATINVISAAQIDHSEQRGHQAPWRPAASIMYCWNAVKKLQKRRLLQITKFIASKLYCYNGKV